MARLNLDLSETHEALIEKLMPLCDLKTKKDVVENALMLLAWAATESSKGFSISAVDEDRKTYKEVHIPALEAARLFVERKERAANSASPKTKTAGKRFAVLS